MINILYIIDHIWNVNGGTEGQLMMLLNNLDKSRCRVHLFCLKETEWTKTAQLGFPLHVLYIKKIFTPGTFVKGISFGRYCRKNKIDIIQTFFNDAYIFGALAGRAAGVRRIISSRRNLGPGFWGRRSLLRAFKILKPLTSRYMTNSQATRESIIAYEGINPDKIDVIYNGLDINRFCAIDGAVRQNTRARLGLKSEDLLIGMVAHLRKEKNFPLFLGAAAAIVKKYPTTKFIIIGEGGERAKIKSQIGNLRLDGAVTLTGSIMDIVPYLAAMDIACLTSDGESFSNSIIEYQAAGLPVVGTAVGGNIEALQSNGFLFPPGDLDSLTRILLRLIDEPELRRQTGERAKAEALEKYSVARMVSEHEAMYHRCLQGS